MILVKMLKKFLVYILLNFSGFAVISGQSTIINTIKPTVEYMLLIRDSLMLQLPKVPKGFIADTPMFETPDIQTQSTYQLTKIYFKTRERGEIQLVIKDYSINEDYYNDQRSEVFNLDKDLIINRSELHDDYNMHLYQSGNESRITLFLSSFVYFEFWENMASVDIEDLKAMLAQCDINLIKRQFLSFVESHKRRSSE